MCISTIITTATTTTASTTWVVVFDVFIFSTRKRTETETEPKEACTNVRLRQTDTLNEREWIQWTTTKQITKHTFYCSPNQLYEVNTDNNGKAFEWIKVWYYALCVIVIYSQSKFNAIVCLSFGFFFHLYLNIMCMNNSDSNDTNSIVEIEMMMCKLFACYLLLDNAAVWCTCSKRCPRAPWTTESNK